MDYKTIEIIQKKLEENRPKRPEKFDGGVFGDSKFAGWYAAEDLIQDLAVETMEKNHNRLIKKYNHK